MRRGISGGYELDDDPARIDLDAVHSFLSSVSYWASGRSFETVERLVRQAARVVGLYHDGVQVGFARAVSDGVAVAYLADVYVLPEHRGRGLLHTRDMHRLYAKVGFGAPGERLMERPAGGAPAAGTELAG